MTSSAFSPNIFSTATSSQGELNVISNPSGTTGTLGWTGVSIVTGTSSPLNPTAPTAFSIANTAGAESATSGGYSTFTLPTSLQNRKLKVEFYFTTPATDVYRVSVYKGGVRVPLSTDASGATTLPASNSGKFTAFFDTDTTATWSVNVTRTTGTTGPCYITNVVVGPGIQPQTGALQEWQDFTIGSFAGTPPSTTLSTRYAKFRRVGDSIEVDIQLIVQAFNYGASAQAANVVYISRLIPSGLTIPSNFFSDRNGFGSLAIFCNNSSTYNISGYSTGFVEWDVSTLAFRFLGNVKDNATTGGCASNLVWGMFGNVVSPVTSDDGMIQINFTVPIAEWAGSGTVQLAQNDVEYASNTLGEGTAAGTIYSNPAYFAYGPNGSGFAGIASTTTTGSSATRYLVKFQTPIQAGDRIELEYYGADNTWVPASSNFEVMPAQMNTAQYGMMIDRNDSTSVYVRFGNAGREAPTTFGAAAVANWASLGGAGRRWRVRKSSAGAAVGFGIVQGTSSGLVPAYNTSFDDVTATRLGLKEYFHGTTYNGGNAPTLSSAQAGFAVDRGLFIPYQMQDGTWRLRFNAVYNFTSASVTSLTVTLANTTFKNVANFFQPISGFFASGTIRNVAYVTPNTSNIVVTGPSAETTNRAYVSGDVELESKPTWAY